MTLATIRALASLLVAVALGCTVVSAGAAPLVSHQTSLVPDYTIWNVKLGDPVAEIPEAAMADIACGTNGGPPSLPLRHFSDYATCPAEPSGLREIYFTLDDEEALIARANEVEALAYQQPTTIYAHPVTFSVLVDDEGISRGFRIITDNRASETARRAAVHLGANLESRYDDWGLDCADLDPDAGEQAVGRIFIHRLCTGASPNGARKVRIESVYMRRKGAQPINRESQTINTDYITSATRMELVQAPYEPDTTPPR
jgi:hypothetical protein